MGSNLFDRLEISGLKPQNTEWSANDFIPIDIPPGKCADLICQFSLDATVVIEVTFDSGSNWAALNSGVAIGANQLFQFDVFTVNGDLINFRTPTAGGANVIFGAIIEDVDA